MNIYDEIILLEDGKPRDRFDNEEVYLIVDTKRKVYWYDGIHNKHRYESRTDIEMFCVNLYKRDLFSRFMNGEYRTHELRKKLFLEQTNPNKLISGISKLMVRYFDTKFKPAPSNQGA